jgi:NodT family efflux transporter outer membrane factor (OMF) lipoprotein
MRSTTFVRVSGLVMVALLAGAMSSAAQSAGARDTAHLPARPPAPLSTDFFGDTTLARLTAEALRANRDVVVAQSRVRQAQAYRLNAALDLAPTITVAGGFTRQRLSQAQFGLEVPDRSLWDTELRAAWELDVFGRLRKNLRGQNALTESAREDVREMGRVITAELATAYYEFRGAQDHLLVAERNAENQRRTLQLTRNRLEAGRGTAFDTERAQAQLSSTQALIPVFESRIAAARHRIGVLVGRDPGLVAKELGTPCVTEEMTDTCAVPELPAEIVAGDLDSLIRYRPDVRAAERRVAAEGAFVGAAKADYLPRLSLGGTAGFTSTAFDSLGNSGSGRYAVGPVVTWPLLNLGRVKANVDAARALEAEARARYEQTVLLAREEVETARVAYGKTRERLTQLEAAAAASNRAAELARLRFEGGVTDFLQVLDAERSLLAAQDQLAQGRTDAVTALVALYRATGGGLAGTR